MCNVIGKEKLKTADLKGFESLTGKHNGVATKLRELETCKTKINIHCICHRCICHSNFEKIFLDLWSF